MQDKLNTMDSFENEGFKIERNGQVITLTQDEMCRFRKLESAIDGRSCFEHFIEFETEDREEIKIAKKLMADEEVCSYLSNDMLLKVHADSYEFELYLIKKAIRRSKNV